MFNKRSTGIVPAPTSENFVYIHTSRRDGGTSFTHSEQKVGATYRLDFSQRLDSDGDLMLVNTMWDLSGRQAPTVGVFFGPFAALVQAAGQPLPPDGLTALVSVMSARDEGQAIYGGPGSAVVAQRFLNPDGSRAAGGTDGEHVYKVSITGPRRDELEGIMATNLADSIAYALTALSRQDGLNSGVLS